MSDEPKITDSEWLRLHRLLLGVLMIESEFLVLT